jgi:hypothetical protein
LVFFFVKTQLPILVSYSGANKKGSGRELQGYGVKGYSMYIPLTIDVLLLNFSTARVVFMSDTIIVKQTFYGLERSFLELKRNAYCLKWVP